MGLEAVIASIEAKGVQEADAILSEAQKKAKAQLDEAQTHTAKESAEAEKTLKHNFEREKAQSQAASEVEAHKEVLKARREVLDGALRATITTLREAPAETHAKILRRLFAQSPEAIAMARLPGTRVFGRAADKPVLAELGIASVDTSRPDILGVLVETADASQAIDLRLDTLVAELWERLGADINRQIFGA
ncbi:MAG TPA: V-type ATP synthase subunit E family protein [Planctomycetota bacterium]|nr:V-type ATP synthase subunit E family protein [Planctomycetota bacterium]